MLKLTLQIILLMFGSLVLNACQQAEPVEEYKDTVLVFGTFVDVTLVGVAAADREAVMQSIEKDLQYYHYAFHPWHSGPTGRVNQLLAATGEFTANPSLIPLIKESKLYSQQSHDLFNPAIGNLIGLWGYHEELPPEGPSPSKKDIEAILAQKPSMESITIHGVRINNTNPAVRLDFGAIAKGYAVDQILQRLKRMGVQNAIINSGGDLKAIGKHGARPWHIGIRDPREKGVIAGLDINDGEAVFTSGDYERFYMEQGKRYHHILDPRTGYPARNSQSVTVVHSNAALADAAATALFVAGPKQWLDIARSMHIHEAMLIDRNGKIYITAALKKRIQFEKPNHDIQVVDTP